MKYKPLMGLCKDCLYKCFRVEEPSFIGVYKCKYYLKEQKDGSRNNKWIQTRIL